MRTRCSARRSRARLCGIQGQGRRRAIFADTHGPPERNREFCVAGAGRAELFCSGMESAQLYRACGGAGDAALGDQSCGQFGEQARTGPVSHPYRLYPARSAGRIEAPDRGDRRRLGAVPRAACRAQLSCDQGRWRRTRCRRPGQARGRWCSGRRCRDGLADARRGRCRLRGCPARLHYSERAGRSRCRHADQGRRIAGSLLLRLAAIRFFVG